MDFKFVFIVLVCSFTTGCLHAQQPSEPVYKLDWKKDGSLVAATIGLTAASYFVDRRNKIITPIQIEQLNICDINAFDRGAIYNYSISADKTSDVFLIGSFLTPSLLMLSPNSRAQSLTIGALYFEAISLTATLTALTKSSTQRVRPYAYNPNVALDDKIVKSTKHAFFSGHVSQVASMSFFTAKVFSDLHPDSPLKPYIWGAAIAAPAITGYLRYRAGKHFPSDVLVGYVVGAAVGYLIPALHKKALNANLSIHGTEGGIVMRYQF